MSSPPPATPANSPSLFESAWLVFRKDLLIEWRTRARLNALIFFAVATLLMFSFAIGPDTPLLRKNAGGYLWLAILLSSVLSLGESFRIESENACLDGLKLVPTDARAIFLGKSLGNTAMLVLLGSIVLPVMIALYDVSFVEGLGKLALVLLGGSAAISAPGTVYAAIAGNARARDVILPLLLFPMLVPALVSAVNATTLVITGDPQDQLRSWLLLLLAFNLVYWSLGFLLFPRVVEE